MTIENHRRGYLRHIDGPGLTQAVTFRLDGSLPVKVLAQMRRDAADLPSSAQRAFLSLAIDAHLDGGEGPTYLAEPAVAELVQSALRHFNRERYLLHAWVIMPNHVHLLLTLLEDFRLRGVMRSLKSYTSKQANQLLGRSGRFWQPDYYDRSIDSEAGFKAMVQYIHENPVKSGIVEDPADFRWSSAFLRPSFLRCARGDWG